MEASNILSIVGIWAAEASKNVYILRKHPGLKLLSPYEAGKEGDDEDIDPTLEKTGEDDG